jgi:hypothetical protein
MQRTIAHVLISPSNENTKGLRQEGECFRVQNGAAEAGLPVGGVFCGVVLV